MKNWKFLLVLCISFLTLYLVFRNIKFQEVFLLIKQVNYFLLACSVLLNIPILLLRAQRWRVIISPIKNVGFINTLSALLVGYMVNNLFFARAGEVAKIYLLSRNEGIHMSENLSTVVVERAYDLMMLGLMTLFVVLTFTVPTQTLFVDITGIPLTVLGSVHILGLIFIALLFLFIVFLFFMKGKHEKVEDFVGKCLGYISCLSEEFIQKTCTVISRFVQGFRCLSLVKTNLKAFFYSIAIWVLSLISAWLCILSIPGIEFSFENVIFLYVLITFAILLPSTPGFVGPYHYAVFVAISFVMVQNQILDIDLIESSAATASVLIHATGYIPITLAGIIFLWKEGIAFSDIKKMQ